VARAFTFIHAADLHLDAPFSGVDAGDARVRECLVESTYEAFDRIVALALARQVDFVLIAGDTFNSRDKALRAQLRFRSACERLREGGIAVYLVQGNHDPADGWSAHLTLPDNVHHFATDRVERVEVLDPASGEALCALYGRGYATGAVKSNLARGFARGSADETAIGVLHANVGGQEGYEPYAPCSLDDLKSAGLDYWALGHIHKTADLCDAPPIRYAGSPQGLNPKEDGAHGCWLVTMERGAVTAEEFVETSQVRWARAELDIASIDGVDELHAALRSICAEAREDAGGRPAILRVDLHGRTQVHAQLGRGSTLEDLVRELSDEQMAEAPWVWIDRVRDLTRGTIDIEFMRGVEDFAGDLVRITDELLQDPDAAASVLAEALGGVDAAFGSRERDPRTLLEQARDACLDRMVGGEDR